MKRNRTTLILLLLCMFGCAELKAATAVFDATNNILATLQKTMDSAFQTIQKANFTTLIKQAKEDYAEQIKIFEECVKQYEECVKIYKQAMKTYDWIDTNIGNARNIKTFLSCGFSSPANLQQLSSLVNNTLPQTATSANSLYNQTILRSADSVIGSDVTDTVAKRGIERQKFAQSSRKVADKCDAMAQTMLSALRAKDQILESRVSSGTADLLQISHAGEQGVIFIAEELSRMNSNVGAINRTVSRQEEAFGEDEMKKAQEAAVHVKMEKANIERGNNYTRNKNSHELIDAAFKNCRVF